MVKEDIFHESTRHLPRDLLWLGREKKSTESEMRLSNCTQTMPNGNIVLVVGPVREALSNERIGKQLLVISGARCESLFRLLIPPTDAHHRVDT